MNTISIKSKSFQLEPFLNWGLFFLYATFISILSLCYHEPWRDEAQIWLIVDNLSYFDVLKQLPSEGHPPLWYSMVFLLAKMGLPYKSMFVFHTLIVLGVAYLFIFKSPFPWYFKISTLCGYYFIFEYGIIARNYSLVILLLFSIATLFPKRFEKPFLYCLLAGLLCTTHVLAFSAGGILLVFYFIELLKMKKIRASYLFSLFLGSVQLFWVLFLLFEAGMKRNYNYDITNHYEQILLTINSAFSTNQTPELFYSFFLVVIIVLLINKPFSAFFMILNTVAFLWLVAFKYAGDNRHHGLLFIFTLFALWITYSQKSLFKKHPFENIHKFICILLLIPIFSQVTFGYEMVQKEINGPFSNSKEVAEFMVANNLQSKFIIGSRSYAASSVLVYFPQKKIWYPDIRRLGTYITFDTNYSSLNKMLDVNRVAFLADSIFPYNKNLLLLLNAELDNRKSNEKWQLIHQSKNISIKTDEYYYLYTKN